MQTDKKDLPSRLTSTYERYGKALEDIDDEASSG